MLSVFPHSKHHLLPLPVLKVLSMFLAINRQKIRKSLLLDIGSNLQGHFEQQTLFGLDEKVHFGRLFGPKLLSIHNEPLRRLSIPIALLRVEQAHSVWLAVNIECPFRQNLKGFSTF